MFRSPTLSSRPEQTTARAVICGVEGPAVFDVTGCEGRVKIESKWTTRKREQAEGRLSPAAETAPLKPKPGLSGPTVALTLTVLSSDRRWPAGRLRLLAGGSDRQSATRYAPQSQLLQRRTEFSRPGSEGIPAALATSGSRQSNRRSRVRGLSAPYKDDARKYDRRSRVSSPQWEPLFR